MTTRSHHHHLLRRRLERCRSVFNEVESFIADNPIIILMFGLVQLSFFKYWPDESWRPFPYYDIPVTENNPNGVIHAQSYGAYFHQYLMFIFAFLYCYVVAPDQRKQMVILILLECFDIADFMLRYNQSYDPVIIFDVVVFQYSYTDIKKILYALVIIIFNGCDKEKNVR
jgi:hypothetical protein